MKPNREVLVVGGGVAGYAAAISLAKLGHAVTVLDRDLSGPHRLGESFDWETPRLMDELDISLDDLVDRDEATIKQGAVATHAMMKGTLRIGLHFFYRVLMALVGRSRETYHVNRSALSRSLNQRAAELNIELVEARAVRVETHGDRVLFVEDENGVRYEADHFLDSTGRARVLAKALAVGVQKIGPQKLAVSARLHHQYNHQGTRIRLDDSLPNPTWLWDINTSEQHTDVGAVFVAEDVAAARRRGMEIPELFRSELARHDDLGWALDQPLAAHELDRVAFQDQVSDRLAGENWVLAGQSAAVIDPILSSGVSFAMRSGLSAASVVHARCSAPVRGEVLARRHDVVLRSYALTVDTLLDELWYKSRLRMIHGFGFNVLLLLVWNFNLNQLQSRWFVQTRLGAKAMIAFHRAVRSFVPGLARAIEAIPRRRPAVTPDQQKVRLQERLS